MKLAPIDHRYGKLPNGWPQPTFMSTDEDGGLNIEWCFGEQGADDSWRVLFSWDPDEGAMVCRTTKERQDFFVEADGDSKKNIMPALDRWLTAPPNESDGAKGDQRT